MTSPVDRDLLNRATEALRDDGAADRPAADESWRAMEGWRHVSRDVRRAARRRRLALIVALELFAGVVGVGSWAAVSGRLPPALARWIPGARRPAAPAPAHAHAARAQRENWVPPASPPAPPVVASPAPPSVPAPDLGPAPSPAAASVVDRPRRPAPRVATAAEDIYARAHRAQFVDRDYASALALWDQYLAATGGSLGPEARWNRAIALVRLGRREAAIAALSPFAAGQDNGYRQEEAQALLRVAGAASP
ncbi:MAG TPA: hypothetical protein VMT03_03525 [Polyangia bacterium]|nr:hypothetical protein [Polyangia bacterium]